MDDAVRRCDFASTEWRAIPQLTELARGRIASAFGVRVVVDRLAPVMLYRYDVGVGFVPHHDEVTEVEIRRARHNGQPVIAGDLTIVGFLSDPNEYEGGDLYFPDRDLSFKPSAGSAVVFPATRDFLHGVAPIAAGTRFSLVARCFVV